VVDECARKLLDDFADRHLAATDVSHTPHHVQRMRDRRPRQTATCKQTHTHTHTFNGPFSGTTRVSRYQKGKTNLDFTEARDSEWQWHQLERRTTAAGGITSPREHDVPPITTQLRDVIVLQLYKS